MINKRRFSIKNTKKVLHKVGKHWVVVSALLLGLVAGGTAVTTQANANADMSANHATQLEAPAPATTQSNPNGIHVSKETNGYVNVNGHNIPTNTQTIKQDAHHYASSANVDNLSKVANVARVNHQSSAYSDFVSLANNASSYNTMSLGNVNDEGSNTAFGIFNNASKDINAIKGNNPELNKISRALDDIDGYAHDTDFKVPVSMAVPNSGESFPNSKVDVNVNKTFTIPGTSNQLTVSDVSVGINSFNYNTDSISSKASASVSFNIPNIISNGIDLQSSANSIVNTLAGSAESLVNSNATSFAETQANKDNVYSQAISNIVSQVSSTAITDLQNEYNTDYKMMLNGLQSPAQNYTGQYGTASTFDSLAKRGGKPQKATKVTQLNAFTTNILTNNPVNSNYDLQPGEATSLETGLANGTPLSTLVSNLEKSLLINKLKSSKYSKDASTLINDLKDSTNVDNTLQSDVPTVLSSVASDNLKSGEANQLINSKIQSLVSSEVDPTISTTTGKINNIISKNLTALGRVLPNVLQNGYLRALSKDNVSDVNSLASKMSVLLSLIPANLPANMNNDKLNGAIDKITKALTDVTKGINDADTILGDVFSNSSLKSDYTSLVSATANLANTYNYSMQYSAYNNIASNTSDLVSGLTGAPHYNAISNYANSAIINEASTSAYSMSSTSASMYNFSSSANNALTSASKANTTLSSIENSLLDSASENVSNASSAYNSTLSGQDTSEPALVTDNITFEYNGSNSTNPTKLTGLSTDKFPANALSSLDSSAGYSLANSDQMIGFNPSNTNVTVSLNSSSSKKPVTPNNTVSETVEFVSGSSVIGTPEPFNSASGTHESMKVPSGYAIENNGTFSYTYDFTLNSKVTSPVKVHVVAVETDIINYTDVKGNKQPSFPLTGVKGTKVPTRALLAKISVPTNYTLSGEPSFYDGGTYNVSVVPVKSNNNNNNGKKPQTSTTDIINYQYNGKTVANQTFAKPANSTSFTLNDSDATHMPSNYHLVNNNQTFNYNGSTTDVAIAPNQATDTINYQYNGKTEATQTFTGNDVSAKGANDTSFDANNNVPNGYHAASNTTFNYDGGTYSVTIAPNQATDTINYILNGQVKSSHQFTGNDVNAKGAGNTSFDANSNVPSGYYATSKTTFNYDGGTYSVTIAKKGTVTPSGNKGNGGKSNQPQPTPVKPQPKPTPTPQPSGNGNSTNPNTNNNNTTNNNGNTNNNNNSNNFAPIMPNITPSVASNTVTSASAEPNSMSTNTSNSSAEPKAHVANYVTVEKELQLHTSPNFTKNNRVMTVEPGTRLDLEKTVRARHGLVRYEVNYKGKSYFVTANKKFTTHLSYELAKPSHYRYFKVGKALQLHTSPYFTKKNGVMTVKPGTEFRINRVVKAHGFVRYEVSYKGSVYFVTANKDFSANAYLQKSNFGKRGHKAVRVIKKLSEYKKLSFAKHSLIRNFRKGSVLPVKRVITIANGEMTRLQLTNGRYVSANKDFVKVIK